MHHLADDTVEEKRRKKGRREEDWNRTQCLVDLPPNSGYSLEPLVPQQGSEHNWEQLEPSYTPASDVNFAVTRASLKSRHRF